MRNDKEKWIDDAFNSLQGSQRAQPPADLFASIESRLKPQNTPIVSMNNWRLAIAASVVILVVNVLALRHYIQQNQVLNTEMAINEDAGQGLISNYNWYD